MTKLDVPVHPVQVHDRIHYRDEGGFAVPQVVSLKAYEVYCDVFGEQGALITGDCRGGFGTGELVALSIGIEVFASLMKN